MSPAVVALALGMLASGALNTLMIKYQDQVTVAHTWDGKPITFYHPAVQAAFMFLGEFLCLIPYCLYWLQSSTGQEVHEEGAGVPRAVPVPVRGPAFVQDATRAIHDPVHEPLLAQPLAGNAAPVGGRAADVGSTTFVFALPTLCDATSTMLMNIGLYYTSASVYQMLRGTVVFFAGLLTVAILKRRLHLHHWQGMMLITVGAFVVGMSSVLDPGSCYPGSNFPPPDPFPPGFPHRHSSEADFGLYEPGAGDAAPWPAGDGVGAMAAAPTPSSGGLPCTGYDPESAPRPLLGNLFVIAAQLFSALQFVVEEKYVKQYRVPALLAVGLEGFWGLVLCCLTLPLFQNIKGPTGWPLDNAKYALADICSKPGLAAAVLATIVSVAVFNWCGVCVTKRLSCTARLSIDACRTVLVWAASLLVGWETFKSVQLLGFFVLVCGSVLYNELLAVIVPDPARLPTHRSSPSPRQPPGPPGPVAYDISPNFYIGGVSTKAHSMGSMGSSEPYSSTATSELWPCQSPEGSRSAAGLATAALGSSRPRVVAGGARRSRHVSPVDPRVASGSLYNAFYSGMDVGAVPLSTTPLWGSGSLSGTAATPRPCDPGVLAGRRAASDSAPSRETLPASETYGFDSTAATPQPADEPLNPLRAALTARTPSGPALVGMLSAELGRTKAASGVGDAHSQRQPSRAGRSAARPTHEAVRGNGHSRPDRRAAQRGSTCGRGRVQGHEPRSPSPGDNRVLGASGEGGCPEPSASHSTGS